MHLDLKPQPAHTNGFADVFLPIDDKFLRQNVQHLLIGWNIHRLGGFNHTRDIGRGDLFIFDCDHSA